MSNNATQSQPWLETLLQVLAQRSGHAANQWASGHDWC
ncbi:MAG: hypothetical protein TH68_05310, partial [Candidatus Synechococcus spongiarum 142]